MKRSEAALCRAVAVLMFFLFLAGAVLPVAASDTAGATDEKSAALGVLTVCSYDPENGVIRIAGTVNHNVMTKAKNCRIALRFTYCSKRSLRFFAFVPLVPPPIRH